MNERLQRAIAYLKGQRIDGLDEKATAAFIQPPPVREIRPAPNKDVDALPKTIELPEYRLLEELVYSEDPKIILLSGKAGTGKTFAVQWLVNRFDGACAVVAPTGLAALQAGGQTIHSLFCFPPRALQPEDIKPPGGRSREIFAHLKLLIIDEISMVRADVMDAIGLFLERFGPKPGQPFGGVKLILVGDLLQLSPIVETQEEKAWIRHRYRSEYFFSADCFRLHSWVPIELNKVFRQTEQEFIELLSKIREGVDVDATLLDLNKSCVGKPKPAEVLEISLVPSRQQADTINRSALASLAGPEIIFHAKVEGKMRQDRKLPSPNDLPLRAGAQVMFTKNDKGRRWVNGTMGKVVEVHSDHVMVCIAGQSKSLKVTEERWEQFGYKWDGLQKKLVTEVTGCFIQIPLAHAWAATIHKAQGQSFDNALVDLGHGAFANGQLYVALSRCRTRGGLRLARAIRKDDVKVDPQILVLCKEIKKIQEGVDCDLLASELKNKRLGKVDAPVATKYDGMDIPL